MIHGLDTGFLVAAEIKEQAKQANARATLHTAATARGGTVPTQVVVCTVSAEHSAPNSRNHPPMAALPDVGGGGRKRSDGDAAMWRTEQARLAGRT